MENLNLKLPDRDKGYRITFESKTTSEAKRYNEMIMDILSEEKIVTFHQVGMVNNPGYHAWEMWKSNPSKVIELAFEKIRKNLEMKKTSKVLTE